MFYHCERCNGYLIRDFGFQSITNERIAYHCINCGNYIDPTILHNRQHSAMEFIPCTHLQS